MLVSDRTGAVPSVIFNEFAPAPLGNDVFAALGQSHAKPVFGNFDPPPNVDVAGASGGMSNAHDRYDVNDDGQVTPIDGCSSSTP